MSQKKATLVGRSYVITHPRLPIAELQSAGAKALASFPTSRHLIGRRGGEVILYVKEYIQAYEIKLEREADYDEAIWCKIVSGHSKLTIALVYRSPNINEKRITQKYKML